EDNHVNNANFSTPGDGSSGRMQMYRWTSPGGIVITSEDPEVSFIVPVATWGWTSVSEVSGEMVTVNSPAGTGGGIEGCTTPYVNAAQVAGKIAVVKRGNCDFGLKALNAQQAGAIGVIIFNNVGGNATAGMAAGTSGGSVTIPVV